MLLILSVSRPGPLDKQRGSINNATRLDKQRGCRLKLSTRKAFVATHKINLLSSFRSCVFRCRELVAELTRRRRTTHLSSTIIYILTTIMATAPARLRALLNRGCHQMPCCFDALSAKLVAASGFPVTFASGFCSCRKRHARHWPPLSYAEMEGVMRRVATALDSQIPVIGDGDTGYGNAVNAKRTVKGYAAAGLAGIMIEDQVAPKRCGHTKGKEVVDRATAVARVQAAVDASREAAGGNVDDSILIVARTDARGTHGLDEALERAVRFREIGVLSAFRTSRSDSYARFLLLHLPTLFLR